MLSMELVSSHSMAHVRREARRFFVEVRGLHQEQTADPSSLFFIGGDGYVRLELNADGTRSRVVVHSHEQDEAAREFAGVIA